MKMKKGAAVAHRELLDATARSQVRASLDHIGGSLSVHQEKLGVASGNNQRIPEDFLHLQECPDFIDLRKVMAHQHGQAVDLAFRLQPLDALRIGNAHPQGGYDALVASPLCIEQDGQEVAHYKISANDCVQRFSGGRELLGDLGCVRRADHALHRPHLDLVHRLARVESLQIVAVARQSKAVSHMLHVRIQFGGESCRVDCAVETFDHTRFTVRILR